MARGPAGASTCNVAVNVNELLASDPARIDECSLQPSARVID